MTSIENVNSSVRHVLAVAFRFAEVEREIMLAPDHQQARLLLAHPCLPFWVGVHVGTVVVEEVALNLRLPWRIQKCVLIGPKIRIVELNLRIISDMACLRRR